VQSTQTLPEHVRKRGLAVILAATFLSWGGFFIVVPLISVHFVDGLGWTAASVGLILAVRQFMQQGTSSLTGVLADRFGPKPLICVGLLIRIAGFLLLAAAGSYLMVMLSALLMAIGGGFFESPQAAATAALTTPEDRQRFFSLSGVVAGLGVSLGTQAGALLLDVNFALVSLTAAASFAIIFFCVLFFFPAISVSNSQENAWRGLERALKDRTFVTFNVILMGYWFMWTQFSISLPLAATAIAGNTSAVAWVYAVNSGVTVLLGYLLPRALEKRLASLPMLLAGILLMAIGFFAISGVNTLAMLLIAVFVISLGMVLTRPSQQTITAGLANPDALGAFLGAASLSLAIGGGIGNYAGGAIYDIGEQSGMTWMPWIIFGSIGLLTAFGLSRMRLRLEVAEQQAVSREQQATA
jgi:DHA1 family multidrug resistance protein-like MFS transporter